ncbi:hypothetical protein AJ87_31850 [Rhizobium yanglingense]|nr:hypothetical protein AJ87_31850 [Rhizobium yanglingense]
MIRRFPAPRRPGLGKIRQKTRFFLNDPLGTICVPLERLFRSPDQPLKENVNAPFFDANGMAHGA